MSNENKLYSATKSMSVTPNDSTNFTDSGSEVTCRGVSVNVAGTVQYKDENGVTRITGTLALGIIHPISTKRIMTGGTATGIFVYW